MDLRDGDQVGRYDQSVGEMTSQNKTRSISTFSISCESSFALRENSPQSHDRG